MHRRERLPEGKNRLRNAGAERRRGGKADLQFAQFTQLRPPRHVGGLVDLRQHPTGLFEKQAPGFTEGDAAVGALEQTSPQFLLQRLYLLAQRWLRDAQQLGGTAKVQFFGHGDEVAQMTQFHTLSNES